MCRYCAGHSGCGWYVGLGRVRRGRGPTGGHAPEGSFRWDRVAKSSAVSSNGGLRRGGRPSLPSLIAFPVVFIVVSYVAR